MIYGLQQERNFLCRTPNLRGYGERSHWPYKYHGPSTESRWIFILLKKKCQLGLIYDMQSTPGSTTPLPSASRLGQRIRGKKKRKKRIICTKLLSLITPWIYNTTRYQVSCFFFFLIYYNVTNNNKSRNWCVIQRTKKDNKKQREMLSGVRINAMFQSCNL